jgi:AcrR family transcriptional regulator
VSNQDRVSDRHRQIIAAAEKVFDAKGYAATTMAAVASQAGIAKGSIYNYFHSKQELFRQVCLDALTGDQAEAGRLAAGAGTAAAKIEGVIDLWHRRLGNYTRFGRLVLEFWATAAREKRDGELAGTFEGLARQGEREIQAILEQGVASGEFREDVKPTAATSLLLAMLRGITVGVIVLGLEVDGEFVAEMKRGIMSGLIGTESPRDAD